MAHTARTICRLQGTHEGGHRYFSRAMPSFRLYKAWPPAMPISQRAQDTNQAPWRCSLLSAETRSRGFGMRLP